MIKLKIKYFILGMLFSIIIGTSFTTFAESAYKTIVVKFDEIKVKVNGIDVAKPNILYNGTTYVPLRAVSEMLNKDVIWNGDIMTAFINNKQNEVTYGIIKNYYELYEGGLQYGKANGYGMMSISSSSISGVEIGRFVNDTLDEGIIKFDSGEIGYLKNGNVIGYVVYKK
jgi:hypothetical protein